MSTLILVRHGQACFGTHDYDRLSETGVRQAELLGIHWAGRALAFDAVYSGEQQRQQQTQRIVGQAYQRAGHPFPDQGIDEAFNEYDAAGIMGQLYPRLLQQDARLREILERTPQLGDASAEGRKAFQRSFEIVLDCWVEGGSEIEGMESWHGFRERVIAGLQRIRSRYPSGKRVAVFTSGGAISTLLGYALDISDRKALAQQWVIKNASLTEFIYSGDKLTLTGFNLTPHFVDDSLVTYR